MSFSTSDEKYMSRAIELAAIGLGKVSPNPPVGCVIVKNEMIISEGWHAVYGGPHAEADALSKLTDASGATAYVTLMPCAHQGKTPPCTQALIDAKISRVVVAVDDPDKTSKDGKRILEDAGVIVDCGLLEKPAAYVMRGFLKRIAKNLPWVTLKYAMTLDGRIALPSGDSKWISCEASREDVQNIRSQSDAVMVGSGTFLADDPRLSVRGETDTQPKRIIIDTHANIKPDARIFDAPKAEVIIICADDIDTKKVSPLMNAHATLIQLPAQNGRLDLRQAMKKLSDLGICNVLCEGGAGLGGSLLEAGLVDEVVAYIAPKIAGGGVSPVAFNPPQSMADALQLSEFTFSQSGADVKLCGMLSDPLSL